jgi:hypothetical protein
MARETIAPEGTPTGTDPMRIAFVFAALLMLAACDVPFIPLI